MQFSFKSALKREYASFFAMIAIFTGLKVLSSLWVDKTFILDPMWTFIFLDQSGLLPDGSISEEKNAPFRRRSLKLSYGN